MTLNQILNNKTIEDRGYITPCWIWKGAIAPNGYGHVWYGGINYSVHKLVFILVNNKSFSIF